MISRPLVSILIPVFNRESFIHETIHSALSQDYANIEVIVVDNQSTDATFSICREIAELNAGKVKVYQNEVNLGPVGNWRKCVEFSSGQFAKILWSDDLMDSCYVSRMVDMFDEDDNVGFAYSSVIIDDIFDTSKRTYYRFGDTGVYSTAQFIERSLFSNDCPVSPGCCFFRMSDLRAALMLDIKSERFMDFSDNGAGPDLLTFLYCANKYKSFAFVDEPLSFFREHPDSISLSMKKVDLLDRYNQARLWFASTQIHNFNVRRLSGHIWVERVFYTKKIKSFNSIPELFGQDIPRPKVSDVFYFFMFSLYNRVITRLMR